MRDRTTRIDSISRSHYFSLLFFALEISEISQIHAAKFYDFILHTSKSKQTPKDYQFDYSDKKRSRIKTISQFHNLIISNEIQQDSHQMITDIRSFDNKDHDY